jgi:hypothetical protein
LAHAFLREYSDKGLKLGQFLGQLGVFLALARGGTVILTELTAARLPGKSLSNDRQ